MGLSSVFAPSEEQDSKWLMIVLHGLGDSADGYLWLPQEMRLPWLNYLLVNGPDEYYGGYSWYDLYGDPAPGITHSRELLTNLLNEQTDKGFPCEKTFMFGFSQGCLMTLETGLCYPKHLAGLIGISGYINDYDDLMRRVSPVAKQQKMLITHGTNDPILPFDRVKKQVQQLQDSGYQVQWHEFLKEHGIAGEEEMKVIRDFASKLHVQG